MRIMLEMIQPNLAQRIWTRGMALVPMPTLWFEAGIVQLLLLILILSFMIMKARQHTQAVSASLNKMRVSHWLDTLLQSTLL